MTCRSKLKSVCITLVTGCPRSELDNAWLFPYFQANRWKIVERVQDADLVVATACAFDSLMEEKSIKRLKLIHRRRKNCSKLVILGCLAGINSPRVIETFNAQTISPAELQKLDELISAEVPIKDIPPVNFTKPNKDRAVRSWQLCDLNLTPSIFNRITKKIKRTLRPLLRKIQRTKTQTQKKSQPEKQKVFNIRVSRGCCEDCTFCAIRLANGALRSKPLDDILTEFDSGLNQGFKLFELLAEDIGCYGTDIGSNMLQLLEVLFSRKEQFQLTFTDINIRYLIKYSPQIIELLAANQNRIKLLRTPFQSGSDKILEMMKRHYNAEQIRQCLNLIKTIAPDIPIETHVLIGFPGETQQDFEKTVQLLKEIQFVKIQIYTYTDRPGTLSVSMDHKIPDDIKKQRVRYLLEQFENAISYPL